MIQQVVEEIKFQDILLSKKLTQAKRTNKLRHWLEYLAMLDQNRTFDRKDQCISQLHTKFVFRQDFWKRQIERKVQQPVFNEDDLEFVMIAMDDGFYLPCAQIICDKLLELVRSNAIRVNLALAKLQILIQQFSIMLEGPQMFYQAVIEIHKRQNNTAQIRRTYQRQIRAGLYNYDVTWLQYQRWEEKLAAEQSEGNATQNLREQSQIQRIGNSRKQQTQKNNSRTEAHVDFKKLFSEGRSSLQHAEIVAEEGGYINQVFGYINATMDGKSSLKQPNRPTSLTVRRALYEMQEANIVLMDYQKYCVFLNLLSSSHQRQWFLRRAALVEPHNLVRQYLDALEDIHQDQDSTFIIINAYKQAISWDCGEQYEKPYLHYLVSRINRHVFTEQPQIYNQSWGEKVQFFRDQIVQLIDKPRHRTASSEKRLRLDYYKYWIKIEESLVKDKEAVCTVYQGLLNQDDSIEVYISQAKSMVTLGDIKKAKYIYEKTCETLKWQNRIVKEYRDFLQVYGSVREVQALVQKAEHSSGSVYRIPTPINTSSSSSNSFSQSKNNQQSCSNQESLRNEKAIVNRHFPPNQQQANCKTPPRQLEQDCSSDSFSLSPKNRKDRLTNQQAKKGKIKQFEENERKQNPSRNTQENRNEVHGTSHAENYSSVSTDLVMHKEAAKTQNSSINNGQQSDVRNQQDKENKQQKSSSQSVIQGKQFIVKDGFSSSSLRHSSDEQENIFKRAKPFVQYGEQHQHQLRQLDKQKKRLHTERSLKTTLYINNLSEQQSQETLKKQLKCPEKVEQIRFIKKNGRHFCYIDYTDEESARKQLALNQRGPLQIHMSSPPSEKSQECTIFLSGLSSSITEQKIFEKVSEGFRSDVDQIRIRSKNHKHIAYVDFSSFESKEHVLKEWVESKMQIDGRTVIARNCLSASNSYRTQNSNISTVGTIFVKNLSFKCDQKTLRNFFEKAGFECLSTVTIPKDDRKRSKGFAYVGFSTVDEYQRALDLKKGQVLNREFQIIKSDRKVREPLQPKTAQKESSPKSNDFFRKMF